MDFRHQLALALAIALVAALVLFFALWTGSGLDRPRAAGWRRVRRWWRRRN